LGHRPTSRCEQQPADSAHICQISLLWLGYRRLLFFLDLLAPLVTGLLLLLLLPL
jgi:hypothetical protein